MNAPVNAIVPEGYSENLQRLAIGFEALDPVRGGRVGWPLRFEVEGPPPRPPADRREPYRRIVRRGQARPVVDRHDSCLYALLYQPHLTPRTMPPGIEPPLVPGDPLTTIDLRIYERARRFVPRRFRLPILPTADAEARPYQDRVRRPALYPGAAYDLSARSTGLRGRVLRGGVPMRWARVEATLDGTATIVGRAHGDDRGEFLLVLAPSAASPVELVDPLPIRVTVSAPDPAPVPATPLLPGQDPLWDLPVEILPAPGALDPVSSGEALPAGYTVTSTRIVPFRLGRLISTADFVFA